MTELCLNIGCSTHRVAGYAGVDANPGPQVDVVARIPPIPYDDGTVAHIYAGHLLEHFPPWDVLTFLGECLRVLAAGGTLTLIVPDVRRISLLANSQVIAGPGCARLILGDDSTPDMQHWTLWTKTRIEDVLDRAGFALDASYDWRTDTRLFDREASWQGGVRGVKV